MRTVLITGCSSGIGMETALAFSRAGDRVYATMRDLSRAIELQSAADREGLSLQLAELDVAAPSTFAALINRLVDESGGIDVLVNNAGVLTTGAFEDASEAVLRKTMEVNFFGPALLTQAVLPTMRRQENGYIINISSLSGVASKGGDAIYAASKFALEGLSEGFRNEVARWNIKTALVEPGQYATKIFRDADENGSENEKSPYRALNAQLRRETQVGGPGGDARDLAALIVKISRSDGARLRWPSDAMAEKVLSSLFAMDDTKRGAFLRDVANLDWWIEGREKPDE